MRVADPRPEPFGSLGGPARGRVRHLPAAPIADENEHPLDEVPVLVR